MCRLRHRVTVPRSEEEAMYQAIVVTKPVAFLPAAAGRTRVVLEG